MKPTFWRDPRGHWSVCDGPGPLNVAGYIFQRPDNTWAVEGDELNRVFLDQLTAASTVLRQELPAGVQYYELKRQDETAFVATYPEVLDSIRAEGWSVVAGSRQLSSK
jgi:hypothetical protein